MNDTRRTRLTLSILLLLFAALMSIPFLVPHLGWAALFGLVPLLCADRVATISGIRRFWIWHYSAFLAWNLATTFWVCNATVGGGLFASLANALQMSLVFGLFRLSKKRFKGTLPYIFLALAWIAWEKMYFNVQISWPWLTLGNSFARTVSLVQWYEYTGTLGGSLWIWASNLGIFGMMCALADGKWQGVWNPKAKAAAVIALTAVFFGPMVLSKIIYHYYEETSDPLQVAVLQPNIDPYHKFEALSQDQQNAILEDQLRRVLAQPRDTAKPLLVLAPETFTSDIITGEWEASRTWRRFTELLRDHPGVNMIFGASAHDIIDTGYRPSRTARRLGERWVETHNSALMVDGTGRTEIFHKSKLVVGVEMTPWPAFFCKIDDMLGGVMGRDVGQKEISLLNVESHRESIPIGCAICYESVYGEYCIGYVRKGARALAVITNDAWWGDTPGYRQHLSYASLRAIETRRDIARCANTGISGFINQRGDITEKSPWWEKAEMTGTINLNDKVTCFVRNGDITGRICTFLFVFLFLALLVRLRTDSQ